MGLAKPIQGAFFTVVARPGIEFGSDNCTQNLVADSGSTGRNLKIEDIFGVTSL